MEVRKSTGLAEEYSRDKVKNGICEAYKAVGEVCDDTIINSIVNGLYLYDNVATSEIRRQVEEALMSIRWRKHTLKRTMTPRE